MGKEDSSERTRLPPMGRIPQNNVNEHASCILEVAKTLELVYGLSVRFRPYNHRCDDTNVSRWMQ